MQNLEKKTMHYMFNKCIINNNIERSGYNRSSTADKNVSSSKYCDVIYTNYKYLVEKGAPIYKKHTSHLDQVNATIKSKSNYITKRQ